MRTTRYLALAVVAFGLAGAAAAPALADVRSNETFRVAGLGPYQFLHLMNGPDESSGVQVLVPGSACNLRATGANQDNWVEVSYRANNGYEYTGWAERWLLTPERGGYNPPAYDAYAQHPDYMSRHRHHAARWPDYSAPQPGYVAPQPDYAAPIYTAPVYQPKPMEQAQTVYSWEHQHDHFYGY